MFWGKSIPHSEVAGAKSEVALVYLVPERRRLPGPPVQGNHAGSHRGPPDLIPFPLWPSALTFHPEPCTRATLASCLTFLILPASFSLSTVCWLLSWECSSIYIDLPNSLFPSSFCSIFAFYQGLPYLPYLQLYHTLSHQLTHTHPIAFVYFIFFLSLGFF